MKAMTKMTSWL